MHWKCNLSVFWLFEVTQKVIKHLNVCILEIKIRQSLSRLFYAAMANKNPAMAQWGRHELLQSLLL